MTDCCVPRAFSIGARVVSIERRPHCGQTSRSRRHSCEQRSRRIRIAPSPCSPRSACCSPHSGRRSTRRLVLLIRDAERVLLAAGLPICSRCCVVRRIERLAIRGIATCAGATRKLLMPTCHARAGQQPRSLSRGLPSVLPSSLRRVRSSAADGSKSSIGLQQASSSRICWPPGPLTISLRRLSASSQPGRRRLNSPSYKTPQTILCSGQAAAGHPACGTRAG
jgi:hypothetical protein